MCNKFEIYQNLGQILSVFGAGTALEAIPARVSKAGENCAILIKDRLGLARWGWPSAPDGRALINIRAETAAEKPMFARDYAMGRRCVAPATAFYEKGRAFRLNNSQVFGLCGLWTMDAEGKPAFALLTREALPPVKAIHHRMPVIVAADKASGWLSGGALPDPPEIADKGLADFPALL